MSVETMAVVLHHSRARGTAKLVLIGIANHAGDGGAWPAVATLARYANVDERTVQRAIAKLVSLGEIRVHVQQGGTRDADDFTRPNRYDVSVACPPWCDRTANHRDTRRMAGPQITIPLGPEAVDKPGDASVTRSPKTEGGVTPVSPGGVTPVSPKPSIEPDHQSPKYVTTDREADRPPIPANPPADELAKARAAMRRASTEIHRRESEPPTAKP